MENNTNSNKTKKTKDDRIQEFKRILGAAKKMFLYALKEEPAIVIGTVIVISISAVTPYVAQWVNSKIIDNIVSVIAEQAQINVLYYYVVAALGIMLFSTLLGEVESYLDLRLYLNLQRKFSDTLVKKQSIIDIEQYENPEIRTLIQTSTENWNRPIEFVALALWSLRPIVSIISAVAILWAFSPILILLVIISSAPSFVSNIVFGRKKWGIWAAEGEVRRDYWNTKRFLTSESPLMEIRIFGARKYLVDRTYALFEKFQNEQLSVENKRTIATTILGIFSVVGFGIAYVIIILATVAQRITIGQLSFYVSTTRSFQGDMRSLFRRMAGLYENGLYTADTFRVLELPQKVQSGNQHLAEKLAPPEIEFKNVSFKYPDTDNYVLKDLNLKIKSGENIAIVGENGAGKTTLIKLLMRFYDVTSGEILLDNIKLKDLDIDDWYLRVATLFQSFNKYHFDAKTNIGVGDIMRTNKLDQIMEAAKKSGAHPFIEKYQNKYDQILSKGFEGGIDPSQGQWQKIALARAFFKDAPILILDEPTSAIDPKSEAEIFDQLFEFTREKTVIIISHRFSTVRNASRIVVLDEGEVIEEGTHEELMALEEGKYKHAFELQRRGYE